VKQTILTTAVLVGLATTAIANSSAESNNVKAILESQSDMWVDILTEAGEDLVSFRPLVGWRCDLNSVKYGFNGDDAVNTFEMAPCGGTGLESEDYLLHVTATAGSVNSIKVLITYEDGSQSDSTMDRNDILVN
jgi:hypothetical protein